MYPVLHIFAILVRTDNFTREVDLCRIRIHIIIF